MKCFAVRFVKWSILLIFLLAIPIACASRGLMPAKDIKSIIGKWEGYGYNSKMGDKFHVSLWVRGDGKWLMSLDTTYLTYGRVFNGAVWVDEDKFIFNTDTPGLSGSANIRSSAGTLWLMYRSNDGATRADLTLTY